MKIFIAILLSIIMNQSLAESAFITEKNINNHEHMLTIFYVLTMMEQVDGKIENNALTYNSCLINEGKA